MRIVIEGIVADYAPSNDVREQLAFIRGETIVLQLNLTKADGEPYAPLDATYEFNMRKKSTGEALRRSGASIPGVGPGAVVFIFGTNDTKFLSEGIYTYDIWMIDGSTYCVVPMSELVLEASLIGLTGPLTPSPAITAIVPQLGTSFVFRANGAAWFLESRSY